MDTKQLLEAVEVLRVVKTLLESQANPWLPVVAAVGGAFVGGISTLIPTYVVESRKRRHVRSNVTNALVAEIQGILAIVEHRKYIDHFREAATFLRSNPEASTLFKIQVPSHYSRVYQANLADLGVVEPRLAAKIIEFHQLVDSIVQDIGPGGLIADEGGSADAFEQLLKIAESARQVGMDVVERQVH